MDRLVATHDVFLSHSSKDKQWADAICAALEGQAIRCWVAPRDITPGEEWGSSIIRGLNSCRIMVLIFSGHADASPQVRREVERAINRSMPVLPLRIEQVAPTGAMEYALGNTHWLDAFSCPIDHKLEMLAHSVKTLLTSPHKRVPEILPVQVIANQPAPKTTARNLSRPLQKLAIGAVITASLLMLGMKFRDHQQSTPHPNSTPASLDQTHASSPSTCNPADSETVYTKSIAIELRFDTKKCVRKPTKTQ
jgi:hypothetical protein